jgi:Domain of unknown function (DUF4253)
MADTTKANALLKAAAGGDAALVLFPTADKLAVVASAGTEGANYGVQTADVIDWLKQVDDENPFHLTFCGHDLVGGAFLRPVKGARKLAERVIEFCPSCPDEGVERPRKVPPAADPARMAVPGRP